MSAISWDFTIAMLPLMIMSYYYYGARPLVMALFCAAAAYAASILCSLLRGKGPCFGDIASINCGLMIALMMPAAVPYYVPIVGAVFAVCIVKHALGGLSNNPFNVTAAGFCFASLTYPQLVFLYTLPLEKLPLFGDIAAKMVESPAYTLKLGGMPHFDPLEMLLGNYPGPMGATIF